MRSDARGGHFRVVIVVGLGLAVVGRRRTWRVVYVTSAGADNVVAGSRSDGGRRCGRAVVIGPLVVDRVASRRPVVVVRRRVAAARRAVDVDGGGARSASNRGRCRLAGVVRTATVGFCRPVVGRIVTAGGGPARGGSTRPSTVVAGRAVVVGGCFPAAAPADRKFCRRVGFAGAWRKHRRGSSTCPIPTASAGHRFVERLDIVVDCRAAAVGGRRQHSTPKRGVQP